jgi:hypothetical protein
LLSDCASTTLEDCVCLPVCFFIPGIPEYPGIQRICLDAVIAKCLSFVIDLLCQLLSRPDFDVCCSSDCCLGVVEDHRPLHPLCVQPFCSLCSLLEGNPYRQQLGVEHLHLSFPDVAAECHPPAFAVAAHGRCSHSPIIRPRPIRPPCVGVRIFLFRPVFCVLFCFLFCSITTRTTGSSPGLGQKTQRRS